MSPLTKIFVVLLVVVSLLQTAGMVVFVNKAQPLQDALDKMKAMRDTSDAKSKALQTALGHEQDLTNQAKAEGESKLAGQGAVIAGLQQQISKLTVDVASLNADKTSRDGQIAALTQNLVWANSAQSKYADQVKTLRDTNEKYVKQQEDDSRKIAELTNLSETLKSEFNNTREQLVSAQDSVQKLEAWVKANNGPLDQILGGGIVPTGAALPSINGVVTEKRTIDGDTYVTLNVGSADGVQKGFAFSILDRQGNFLGLVSVTKVDNNFSIGKFSGAPDKVNQVQPSDDAKTQIRGS